MRSAAYFLTAAVICLIATGCETTRVNKLHASFEYASDIATTPHPDPKFASIATGIPPVPGSPTGAGADGTQPVNDSQARISPGSERGWPTAPREQAPARFIRQ